MTGVSSRSTTSSLFPSSGRGVGGRGRDGRAFGMGGPHNAVGTHAVGGVVGVRSSPSECVVSLRIPSECWLWEPVVSSETSLLPGLLEDSATKLVSGVRTLEVPEEGWLPPPTLAEEDCDDIPLPTKRVETGAPLLRIILISRCCLMYARTVLPVSCANTTLISNAWRSLLLNS